MIKRLFTDIASVYDRMNHVLSLGRDRRWRCLAAGRVTGSPRRILDLACGTGDLTLTLARRFPEAELTGLDLTPAMLARAKAKCADARIAFLEGDATVLPFATGTTFDLVSCAFGLRNIPDKRRVLAEARRVLVPEGELLVLEFFRPSCRLLSAFTAAWLKALVFLFVRSRSAAYRHLRESMASTLSEREFVALAAEEGFVLASRAFFIPCCTCLLFRVVGGSS